MDEREQLHGDEEYIPEREREAAEAAAASGADAGSEEAEESERALAEADAGAAGAPPATDEAVLEEVEDPDLYPEEDDDIA